MSLWWSVSGLGVIVGYEGQKENSFFEDTIGSQPFPYTKSVMQNLIVYVCVCGGGRVRNVEGPPLLE